ncbi:glutaredoxin [Ulvibacter litoralis]|uniref:Glutaredoxin n=1 Tax=Ulvibacter litoralis TaxID=227084 RepID=A0A1G7IUM3_9FLAO|nr:glutaredoxin [Ulvibacter litoralis]GHC63326.1 hypothetical protein GCM10008083_30750 [Ulvibacter litoralis]SDF16370.1 Glutaredoxin [Ulvibacter litoralis]
MTHKILLFLTLLISGTLLSQEKRILISEKKQGKRTILFAENTTKDTLNVFFMVLSEGYRRSANRPTIKDIPPHSKTPMITLIEISGTAASYEYTLVVNEEENNLNFTPEKKEKDIEKVITNKLVVFTMNDCEKCTELSASLENKGISHRAFNIHEDDMLYNQFIAFIEKKSPDTLKIQFPVIWNKTHHIFGYDTLEDIHKILLD